MDANRYTRVSIVSPLPGQFQPEILANAKQGDIDESIVERESTRTKIADLLSGKATSADPQAEAYRLLVVAACNHWHTGMPFLFEKIQDYTELLMPEDLLSGKSILSYTREALTPAACEDVEAIGWLYQFYISEKKDLVFEGLKKNQKITPENIPAATQLFTPHWIVRYLVENSLGRLWLLNRPESQIFKNMQGKGQDCYYIEPSEPETDFLKISSPEEIKICDPACGSGHMLTYAFDLLYAIYEEAGYPTEEIPEKILTHNLYGVEIDERAGELAAFALTMKAAAKLSGSKQRRFFRKGISPNICVLENVVFEAGELKDYMNYVGRDLFTAPLQTTLRQFEEADNFGSLIRPELTDVAGIREILKSQDFSSDWIYKAAHEKALKALEQADYLSPKYHVVVANPPYMGSKGMNGRLASWAKENYPDSKSDLFAMFMERTLAMSLAQGMMAMINMQSWMFLSSFEKLRAKLLSNATLLSMAHLGERGFDTIGGAVVSTTAFVIKNTHDLKYKGTYVRLVDGRSEAEKSGMIIEAICNPRCKWLHFAAATDFSQIPGNPIAYWVSELVFKAFSEHTPLGEIASPKIGMRTGDNERFLRLWFEIPESNFRHPSRLSNDNKWVPYNKGGEFRRWYGNLEFVVNWEDDGYEIKEATLAAYPQLSWDNLGWKISNEAFYFQEGVTWTDLSSSSFGVRLLPSGMIFDAAGPAIFGPEPELLLAQMGCKVSFEILKVLNPTLHFKNYNIAALPTPQTENIASAREITPSLVNRSKRDWNSYETAWDFTNSPLLSSDYHQMSISKCYLKMSQYWSKEVTEMQRLEEENNRIFIEAYGLQDELTPDVPLKEITLTCNPHYRYGANKTEAELEALLLADTMREFISYAVGCMFGRYALEKPGLILANQGETFADYLKHVPEPSFPADDDNVIPMLDGEWFTDDISERFKTFLKLTFGTDNYDENLSFIESALGKKGKPLAIRNYFLKEFYTDHVKRYKKRPIYWLFASPKGSFNALIYMHRYRPETVGIVLNDYLRNFKTKLAARLDNETALSIDANADGPAKTKALKEVEKLKKMLVELENWEREVLFPLASEKLAIDLDDGVKHNYPRFGKALKKIPGLS
jgi:type II restriction/modification system DNA methylase subunit YeeA